MQFESLIFMVLKNKCFIFQELNEKYKYSQFCLNWTGLEAVEQAPL